MQLVIIIVQIVVAGYLIFAAITGKSRIFQSSYVKEGKEAQYKKLAKLGFFVIAALLLVLVSLNIMMYVKGEGFDAYLIENKDMMNVQEADTLETVLARLPENIQADYRLLESLYSISQVMTGVVLTALLAMLFMLNSMQDKKKKALPQRNTAPRAAFFFDEEENKGAKRK